ncbi:MAG: deoxyribodipyrimidine photo-lyase [Flavipsychrobacter sp.]|nr:deoxyribodipyrimidine photo-lyase [Flavipsychrobacter sp.]
MRQPITIFWFRRDLRLDDNAGLYHALKTGIPVLPVFIFDTEILDLLENKKDKRVHFIHNAISDMQGKLVKMGSTLHVLHSTPNESFKQLTEEYNITAVYTNRDYEPSAIKRDEDIEQFLKKKDIPFYSFKDQVIFEQKEVVKDNGEPYTVFTPYSRKWKERLNGFYLKPYPTKKYYHNFYKQAPERIPSLAALGFKEAPPGIVPAKLNEEIAKRYDETRDFPAMHGTTRLSVHLRFGTVSIRHLATQATELNATLLNELIWRDFYQAILSNFPHVVNGAFKKEYDNIPWRNNEQEFELWCAGQTGYPIIDAGMRELNETGFMHNRVRMIVASFLTKDLLIDWRWGEAYFAEKLLDYDLAANNGGWQWAAGSGCDAAPYFRVFNPYLQTQKFDPELKYIRHWVPEYDELTYVQPIVDHSMARERCLKAYKTGLNK